VKILKTQISEIGGRMVSVSLTLGDLSDYESSETRAILDTKVQRKGVSLELLQLAALQGLAQSIRQLCDELQTKIVEHQ